MVSNEYDLIPGVKCTNGRKIIPELAPREPRKGARLAHMYLPQHKRFQALCQTPVLFLLNKLTTKKSEI